MKTFRIIADLLLLILIFWLPWWAAGILLLIALFIFDAYYEIIVAGILLDSLYSAPLSRFYHVQFVVTISALVLFILIQAIKSRLRFYR